MFGNSITIFKLFGFEVKVDLSWIILGILVTWTLAEGFFPSEYGGLPQATYWYMGVTCAIGFFVSIIFHEFCHSVVARKYGLPIKGITLFVFGGVSEMEDEPQSARVEFLMAIAGPLSSIALGLIFHGLYSFFSTGGFSLPIIGVTHYLSYINFLLAGFNLMPAFPLDGGRVLRSALWQWKGNVRWATHVASGAGSIFGLGMIFIGILAFFNGNIIGGVWMFLIGFFLRGAAKASYRQVILLKMLEGEKVQRFIKGKPITVPPSTTLEDFVEQFYLKHHFKIFPVTENGDIDGFIDIAQVKQISREHWKEHTVRELLVKSAPDNTVDLSADASNVLSQMNRTGNSTLMVTEDGKLEGIVSQSDIIRYCVSRMELEDGGGTRKKQRHQYR